VHWRAASARFLGVSKHARRNITRAFPELSGIEIGRIVAGMWDNLGRVAAEYPHLRKICVFEAGGRIETHGFEHVDRAVATGRRMIGHIANWEIAMLAGIQHRISVAQIYRAGNNPLLDRMITRFRGDEGELIPKGRIAARRAIAALRRGTHLTLLADQKMNDGIPVPFFGRPAMTAPALAVLALRFDCDVLPARVERLDGARFRLTVFPPLPVTRSGDFHADAAALMTRVNATLEEWIRDRPEQWLWVHRRCRISRLSASSIGKRTSAPTSCRSERGAFAYQGVLWVLSNPFRPCRPAASPVHPWARVCRQSLPRW